jgi:hypothetical protein
VTLTLQAKDAAGNNLTSGGRTVVFTQSGGGSQGTIGAATDNANGTYTASFTGTVAGTATTIGATVDGAAVASTLPTVTVVPGSVSTATSMVTVSDSTVASGSSVTLTLQAKDAAGNNLTSGGRTVVFTQSGGGSQGTIGATTDNANGTYTASFTGTVAGTATTIGATIDRASTTSASPNITVIPGPPVSLVIRPSALILAATEARQVSVTAQDAFGNLAPTESALLSSASTAVAAVDGLIVTGQGDGATEVIAALGVTADTIPVIVAGADRLLVRMLYAAGASRDSSLSPAQLIALDVTVDASRAPTRSVGSFTLNLSADASVVLVDSITAVDVPDLFVNLSQRLAGVARFGGFAATGIPASSVVARVWLRVVGAAGTRSRLTLTCDDLTDVTTLDDLRPLVFLVDARVRLQ